MWRVFNKTLVSVNNPGQLQKAGKSGQNARFLFRELRPPFCGHCPLRGVGFGKFCFGFTFWEKGWAIPFPNGIFVFPDGFYGRHRPEEKHTVRRTITKNSGSPFRRFPLLGINRTGAGCRSCYFQSLKISSIALSMAAFKLFSTIRLSSA